MLHDGNQANRRGRRPILEWALAGAAAAALLWAGMPASSSQELPSGGGPVPPLRRGAGGQIEIVPPSSAGPPESGRHSAAPAAIAPRPAPPRAIPSGAGPAVRGRAPSVPAQPIITVTPVTPRVPDTTLRGATIATFSVVMSDGSPFTGTVRFGSPYHDGRGVFALSGNKIIVNPEGPGIGPNRTTITTHITLEAIP